MKTIIFFLSSALFAAEPAMTPVPEKTVQPSLAADVSKISEAMGHLIGKNMESIGFKFDIAQVVKGLTDAAEGKDAPMSEMECVQAITAIQEAAFKAEAKSNLQKAETFLGTNKDEKGVVSLENNKLQYRIEKEGTGPVIEEHFSPLVRYAGKFLDGKTFDAPKEDALLSLDETIPGFSKGLLGMKEGEKRLLFIHPDLGYGTAGYLPPNSLLTFEVEVIKANAPQSEPLDSLSSGNPKGNPEIAHPLEDQKAIR